MQGILTRLMHIGIYPGMSIAEERKVLLINRFALVAFLTFALSGLNNLSLGDTPSFLILEGFALFQLSTLFFNFLHDYKLARFILIFFVNIGIFYFDGYAGVAAGVYLFYFPLILAMAFLFEFGKQKKEIVFYFSVTLLFVIASIATGHELFRNADISVSVIERMFVYNLVVSLVIIGYFIYIIDRSNTESKRHLIEIIREKHQQEEIIRQSLKDKELLLAEVHHRVKNNLAVISSLLNLQMNLVENQYTRDILQDSKNRVSSMALIHEKLYRSDSLSRISFRQYVEELLEEIRKSFVLESDKVKFEIYVEEFSMGLTSAIPSGLLLNELITNSIKHAFKERETGTIKIFIQKQENGKVHMEVSDDGPGFHFREKQSLGKSLGIILIESLSDQLEGKWEFHFEHGTRFTIEFTMPEEKELHLA